MPVAAGARPRQRPAGPSGALWVGLFCLGLFSFLAILQRPFGSSSWPGLVPAPAPVQPSWSQILDPTASVSGDGQGIIGLLHEPGGATTLVTITGSGTFGDRTPVPEATFAGFTKGRATVVRAHPAALGIIRGTAVEWVPLGEPGGPTLSVSQAAFGGAGDCLLLTTTDAGQPPRQVLSLTATGKVRWRLDLPDGTVTSMAPGPDGLAAVAAFAPGPQPRAWVTVVAPDGTVKARYETGTDPLYSLALAGTGDVMAALDAGHTWIIDLSAETTRGLAAEWPRSAAFLPSGALCVVDQAGLVVSINREARVNWRRQLGGPATGLSAQADGGLVVLGDDRLYWLDAAGRARRTITLPDRPRQAVALPDQGGLAVLIGARLSAYPSPGP